MKTIKLNNGKEVTGEFNLVGTCNDGSTRTIESYNNAEEVLYAFYYLTINKKHLPQNGDGEGVNVEQYESFFIDIETDENESYSIDEAIEYLV
jgi:hypothetical protein